MIGMRNAAAGKLNISKMESVQMGNITLPLGIHHLYHIFLLLLILILTLIFTFMILLLGPVLFLDPLARRFGMLVDEEYGRGILKHDPMHLPSRTSESP